MRLHPRSRPVAIARNELQGLIWHFAEEHDLTYIELAQALNEASAGVLKYMLRMERHPDEYRKATEADLRAENERLRALSATCSCGTSPMTYEGPEADCAVHGAIRSFNEAQVEVERLRKELDEIPYLGAAIRLRETGLTYAVSSLGTSGAGIAVVNLVEVRDWVARRRANGLPVTKALLAAVDALPSTR